MWVAAVPILVFDELARCGRLCLYGRIIHPKRYQSYCAKRYCNSMPPRSLCKIANLYPFILEIGVALLARIIKI